MAVVLLNHATVSVAEELGDFLQRDARLDHPRRRRVPERVRRDDARVELRSNDGGAKRPPDVVADWLAADFEHMDRMRRRLALLTKEGVNPRRHLDDRTMLRRPRATTWIEVDGAGVKIHLFPGEVEQSAGTRAGRYRQLDEKARMSLLRGEKQRAKLFTCQPMRLTADVRKLLDFGVR